MIRVLFFIPVLLWLGLASPMASEIPVAGKPVLVELFTSQGCVNCPKANRFLAELTEDPGVITLSLAVDYWDYLGWKDTFAMSDFTKRQQAYGDSLKTRRPYTPQMIIDGQTSIKGTRQDKVRHMVKKLRKQAANGPVISLVRDGEQLRLNIAAGLAPKGGAQILIADFLPGIQHVAIKGGENEGKTVDQVNMVTRLRPVGRWEGQAMNLLIPAMKIGSCVVILQEDNFGRVLAVSRLDG